jgi:hypothetical protein
VVDAGALPYALRVPFLNHEAARAAGRALRSRQAVWLAGGPGTGAYEVARALHRRGDPLGFVSVRRPLTSVTELEARLAASIDSDPTGDPVSLYVERIERQSLAIHECVVRYGDEGARSQGRVIAVRVLAQSDEGCRSTELLPALRHRLLPLVIQLPSLAARHSEIPALARALTEEIAAELGVGVPPIEDRAFAELAERDWPGNLDELGAVVTRALLDAEGQRVESFEPNRPARSLYLLKPAEEPAPPSYQSVQPREIESIIAELAHELKNPMVTIKTFAENLDALLKDASLRAKFVALTCEAIDRMDGFLEELLRFSRFSDPHPRTLSLPQTVSVAVGSMEESLRARIKLNGIAAKQWIRGDEDQLGFALRSLFRGLCREMTGEASVRVSSAGADLVLATEGGGGPQQKLAGLLDHAANGNAPPSLDFIMADALLRRNGGSTRLERTNDAVNVRLKFASAEPGTHE